MKKEGILLAGFVLLFSLILFAPQVQSYSGSGTGPYNCSGCSDCNNAIGNASNGATIFLNKSLTGANVVNDSYLGTGTCIFFPLSFSTPEQNITIDCSGNSITGNLSGYGIRLSTPGILARNITIKNCNIQNFSYGISLGYLANSTIFNNTIASNWGPYAYGLDVEFSSKITIYNNTFNSNGYGIYAYSTPYTNISNNVFVSNGSGIAIYLGSGDYSTLFNNTISQNAYGITLSSSPNLTIVGNNLTNNLINLNLNTVTQTISGLINYIVANNTINGKQLYYWVNHSNEIINYSSNPGLIAIINSTNITIRDVNMSNNGAGVTFFIPAIQQLLMRL